MRRMNVIAALCLATVLGATGVQVFARQKLEKPPAARRGQPSKPSAARWRYHLVRLVMENDLATRANEEAARGWEVNQVIQVNASPQFDILFRRPVEVRE